MGQFQHIAADQGADDSDDEVAQQPAATQDEAGNPTGDEPGEEKIRSDCSSGVMISKSSRANGSSAEARRQRDFTRPEKPATARNESAQPTTTWNHR